MEKKAQKKSSTSYLLSLLDKFAVLLLSLLINNLLGLFLFINNCFNRSPKSGEDAFGASDEKEAESWSSKDDGKGGKRKQKNKKRTQENKKKEHKKEDEKRKELFHEAHDATVQKKRKTLNSEEYDIAGNEEEKRSRKRKSKSTENEQTKQEKQQKENVSKSEAGSRKMKREDNDRVQPPSKNLRGENHIIYGVTRTVLVGNLPEGRRTSSAISGGYAFKSTVEAV